MKYKKKVLQLAKEHRKAGEKQKADHYYMPKDDVKPTEKYEEDDTEKGPNYEQKRWEEDHVGAAIMRFGARDAKEKAREKKSVKDYDVIMDEEIEFIQALQMPGTRKVKIVPSLAVYI